MNGGTGVKQTSSSQQNGFKNSKTYGSSPTLHQQTFGSSLSAQQQAMFHSSGRLNRWAGSDYSQSAPAHRLGKGINNPGLKVNLQVCLYLLYLV